MIDSGLKNAYFSSTFCVSLFTLECSLSKMSFIVSVLLWSAMIRVLVFSFVLVSSSSISVSFFFVIRIIMSFLMRFLSKACIGWFSSSSI